MRYTITADAQGSRPLATAGFTADTAKKALEKAEELVRSGLHNVTIRTEDGRSYSVDEFRVIVDSVDVRSV